MKRKGFTLIELLAVIIILGILFLVAIPVASQHVNNSKKETYVDTIKKLNDGVKALISDNRIHIYNYDTTYYIPVSAIDLETGKARSPYGELNNAYIVITTDEVNLSYYFVGKDKQDIGIGSLKLINKLNKSDIGDVMSSIDTGVGVGDRPKIMIFNQDLSEGAVTEATSTVPEQ